MGRRRKMLSLVVTGSAVATGTVFAAIGAADAPRGASPELTGVPAANTRSDGYAPASRLSPELAQIVVAQGSTKLENPSPLTSYYGNDNDTLNGAGEPQMVPMTTNPTEAHKTEPRQEHLPGAQGPARRRSGVRLRPSLPVPGPRGRRRWASAASRASTSMPMRRIV